MFYKKEVLKSCLVNFLFISLLASTVFAYSGGTGDPNSPYQIADTNDLLALAFSSTDYNKCFILTADINMAGQVFTTAIISYLEGTFDGNGHKITNFTIYSENSSYLGLFGHVYNTGSVKNLGLEGCAVSGYSTVAGSDHVGGLVGDNHGNISNCYSTGMANGSSVDVGGLVGYNHGNISNCYSMGSVSGNSYVGSLVGYNYNGSISNCYSTGSASGFRYVGGLVGKNYYGSISNCYSTGSVIGYYSSWGGDVDVGGLAGYNYNGSISNCYSTGTVSGYYYVGGLVGDNDGSISDCYSTGSASGIDPNYVGGLVGYDNGGGSVLACFWDTQTSGQTNSAGGKGLTASQMKSVIYYQNAGWVDKGWVINDGLDYPRLAWENTGGIPIPKPQTIPLTGSGTEQDPYQILTVDDFVLLNQYISVLDKHIVLMADLDLSGITFYPIGYNMGTFTGVFDGNGHVIRKININMPGNNCIGLFGYINTDGQIRNLGVEDVNITGGSEVGGLVGWNNTGSISNCYSTGTVSGSYHVGGLVGWNNTGSISNCYSTGTAGGPSNSNVGGLVGTNYGGSISNCYSTGTVIGSSEVGGLMGYNGGSIANCYSTGTVSGSAIVGGLVGDNGYSISNCYSTGTVSGSSGVGGLVGVNGSGNVNGGSISNCYSTGTVNCSSQQVGGLVGCNYGSIRNCYSTGTVSGSSDDVGGLVGSNGGSISDCYSTDNVSGTSWVGGLVGGNWGSNSSIRNCYSTGTVSGSSDNVGGLVGLNYNGGSISDCYSTGAVSGIDPNYVGGLVGYDNNGGSVANCFWDVNTSGQTTSADGEGKITAEMKTLSTFTSVGWDFSYTDGNEAVWFMQINEYPILVWQISPADIYTDGKNNFRDFAVLAQYWMRDDCRMYNNYCDWSDLNFDGVVDIDDLFEFMTYWLQSGIYE